MYDIGDQVDLEIYVYDDDGDLATATVTLTITLPDGTATSPTDTTPSTGRYVASYTPTMAGTHYVKWAAVSVGGTVGEDTVYEDSFTVSASNNAFISLAEAKAELSILSTADDDVLLPYVEWACVLAERVADTDFSRKTITAEKHDVYGTRTAVCLRHRPVLSVTTVTERGTTLAATEYATDARWGMLKRMAGTYDRATWAEGTNSVSVTYVAGWTVIPADVRKATLQILEHLWENQRGTLSGRPTQAQEFPNAGVNWNLPNKARDTLMDFRPPAIA